MVIDTEQGARESQNLAEGDKDGIMNFAGGRQNKTGYEKPASDDDKCDGGEKLQCRFMFVQIHNFVG